MTNNKNEITFTLEEDKINDLVNSMKKLGLNIDEEFIKWTERYVKYGQNDEAPFSENIVDKNRIYYNTLKMKIDKWLEKKNSVPFYLIKAFFESGTSTGLAMERYTTKKGEMRNAFCTYDEKLTPEVFDRNIKLMCTNSKSGYGVFFRIRRDRDDEARSELTLYNSMGNSIGRYITSKKNEFIQSD